MKRRIQLPHGKIIEIALFNKPKPSLHICPNCKLGNVIPYDCKEYDQDHWDITLRCPECETWQIVIAPESDCKLFDEYLSDSFDLLERDYRSLVRSNQADEIDNFAYALRHDLILPEDFDF